jgi:hypothetical protein
MEENSMDERPNYVSAMTIMPIVSGVINILAAIGLFILVLIGTLGIGLLCAPLFLVPFILGIFEILYGINLNNNKAKNTIVIAILEMCSLLWGNVVSAIMGVLLLVFSNDPQVKEYFAQHGMT